MKHVNPANSENRSLSRYIKDKLGITLKAFAEHENTPVRTLQDRWSSDIGRLRVQDSVIRYYVERFNRL